jgi:DNA-binding MarR family transcriptional regulator
MLRREAGAVDGRSVDVVLTPEGLELAERLHARAGVLVGDLTSGLGAQEQRRLAALLERVGRPA